VEKWPRSISYVSTPVREMVSPRTWTPGSGLSIEPCMATDTVDFMSTAMNCARTVFWASTITTLPDATPVRVVPLKSTQSAVSVRPSAWTTFTSPVASYRSRSLS
jgi:hypothetical protein